MAPAHNLPAQLSSFIGRQRELAELDALLATTRLLTLTGAGGVGKTRLALEAAGRAMPRFPDGVWLVDLAPLTEPALLLQTVAATLSISNQGDRPLLERVTGTLAARACLLLLDNCEHLIDACAQLVQTLLRACPHLSILATSREALRVTGEAAWPCPPCRCPTQSVR